jgi:murein DD-endopeptidase MepM/ murein hydrolase activator NlpD
MNARLRFRSPGLLAVVLGLAGAAAIAMAAARPAEQPRAALPVLAPVHAQTGRVDTLFAGGYASGSFTEAMRTLAADLAPAEREMVGQHLDKVFAGVLEQGGLGSAGRLRVAFERTVRPDGRTRSIRVLAAEAAVAGELHTAFYHEEDGKPGYYDPFGRSLEAHAWSGPLEGSHRVSSAFGARRVHPILHRVLPHLGVDLAAPRGMPVHATADGVVVDAGWHGGYGNLVEVQHPNGYSTRYAHLSAILVRPGTPVKQGDELGRVGMTGLATGPHLHYEVRRGGRAVDPLVATAAAAGTQLASDDDWPAERHRLAQLLSRTPTLLRVD